MVPQIKWLKAPPPEFDFLTFEEADRLIEAADKDWRAMITVALRTGLRLGELLALRLSDVDLDARRIIVRRAVARGAVGTPKNGRTREVGLSKQAASALRDHLRPGSVVFAAADGSMLTKGTTKWPLWTAAKKAGLRRIGWHVARQTFASHLVMRGAPLKTVQELMGHSTIEMTMRYSFIYFDADLQRRILPLLHHCLNKPGYLFLGSSEAIAGFGELFVPIDKKNRIYLKSGESPTMSETKRSATSSSFSRRSPQAKPPKAGR